MGEVQSNFPASVMAVLLRCTVPVQNIVSRMTGMEL